MLSSGWRRMLSSQYAVLWLFAPSLSLQRVEGLDHSLASALGTGRVGTSHKAPVSNGVVAQRLWRLQQAAPSELSCSQSSMALLSGSVKAAKLRCSQAQPELQS